MNRRELIKSVACLTVAASVPGAAALGREELDPRIVWHVERFDHDARWGLCGSLTADGARRRYAMWTDKGTPFKDPIMMHKLSREIQHVLLG